MLTPAGRVFLDEARRTLAQSEDAIRLARRAASEELADISITFVSAALYHILPAAIRAFRERRPKATIRLDERPTDAQLKDLASGEIDVGFLHPPIHPVERVSVEVIQRDKLVVAVPAQDVLGGSGGCRIADLSKRDFILFPHKQGPSLHSAITNSCRASGFVPNITQEARQMHTILSLVSAGLGISLVPSGATSMKLEGVKFLTLIDATDDLRWELALAWRLRGTMRPVQDFIEMARNAGRGDG